MKWKKKGEVLSITLIVVLCLLASLSSLCLKIQHNAKTLSQMKDMQILRRIENTICGHILYNHKNAMLFSEYIRTDDYEIYYTVDDMGDDYLIDCFIQYKDIEKNYSMNLVKKTNVIVDFRNLGSYE